MDHAIFGQNLVCRRRNISDNLTFLSMPSATWKPEIRAILWPFCEFWPASTLFVNGQRHLETRNPVIASTLFPVPGRRILDKKLMDHVIFGQNLVCRRRNISDNLTFLSMPSSHLETRNPGHFVAASTLFPVPGKENTR